MAKIVDKDLKKLRIVEASIKVVAKKGFKNTKIADIAKAANMAKGTIYIYFKSKEEILTASLQHIIDKYEKTAGESIAHISDPGKKMRTFFDVWVKVFDDEFEDSIEFLLDFWAEGLHGRIFSHTNKMWEIHKGFRFKIREQLEKCIDDENLKTIDPTLLSTIIIGAADGILLQWIIAEKSFDLKKAYQVFGDIIVKKIFSKN